MQIKQIIIIFLLHHSYQFKDVYNDETLLDCKNTSSYIDSYQKALNLYPADTYMFLIFGPISILASILIILIYVLFPNLRQPPSDLQIGIATSNLIFSIHLFMTGIYALIYNSAPQNDDIFCNISGVLYSIGFNAGFFYNIAYIIISMRIFRNPLNLLKSLYIILIHSSIILITLSGTIYVYLDDLIELNLSGQCSISGLFKQGNSGVMIYPITFFFIYLTLAIVSLTLFKKIIPDQKQIYSKKQIFLDIYIQFVATTACFEGLLAMLSIIISLNCYYFQIASLNILETFYNSLSVLLPIFQTVIIFREPSLKYKLNSFYNRITRKKKSDAKILEMELNLDQRDQQKSVPILSQIKSQLRSTQVYTFLVGIQIANSRNLQSFKCQTVQEQQEINDINKTGDVIFDLNSSNEKVIFQIKNFINDENILKDTFDSSITYYSPQIFEYLISKDYPLIDLAQSLDLEKNKQKILQYASGPDGGKSGEFFYFTWDNQIIIKTMQKSELVALRKRMLSYSQYLSENPESLISKFYGLYTFKRLDFNQENNEVHIFLMINISLGIPRNYIKRTFDMKGSTYERQVIKKNKFKGQDLSKITLKDIDFAETEGQIWIESAQLDKYIQQLTNDSNFLRNQKLIDYSLLVMKIDWGQYIQDNQSSYEKVFQNVQNPLLISSSVKENGIFYHIAIIDYLQEWNANKAAEQLLKQVKELNPSLDTSSQEPDIYGIRFQDKLVKQIFLLDQNNISILSNSDYVSGSGDQSFIDSLQE